MISLVIGILITVVLGAILFWAIDRFVATPNSRNFSNYSSCWSV